MEASRFLFHEYRRDIFGGEIGLVVLLQKGQQNTKRKNQSPQLN